jgi:UDP-N-acetylglucosamine 2-epimerase (non-hydrolysing)
MRVVSVVGARPQIIKLAPVSEAMTQASIDHQVIHTGQHYDWTMSDGLFVDFELKKPNFNLGVGSGSHAAMTGAVMTSIEPILESLNPDWVIVYGDTNTTLAATLAAVKLGIRVIHLEAGLRSFNRTMPEEINRVLVDHASDLLLVPTQLAMANLEREGLSSRAVLTGDVMADICLRVAASVQENSPSIDLPVGDFILATIHRPSNSDHPDRLRGIVQSLSESPIPVILPTHPRLLNRLTDYELELGGSIIPLSPMDYSTLIFTLLNARAVVTDSGGLQKEAYILGTPCTTIRSETEWPETLEGDWNRLCYDLPSDWIDSIALRGVPAEYRPPHFGNGTASNTVAECIVERT